jgi:hypothetical protein
MEQGWNDIETKNRWTRRNLSQCHCVHNKPKYYHTSHKNFTDRQVKNNKRTSQSRASISQNNDIVVESKRKMVYSKHKNSHPESNVKTVNTFIPCAGNDTTVISQMNWKPS